MKKLFAVCLVTLALSSARAAILLDETFSYANGSLTTNSAGAWSTHSGTVGQLDVTNGAAFLTSADSEDLNRPLAGQPYGAGNPTNVFYARFILRQLSLPTATGGYWANFNSTSFRACIWSQTAGAASGQFRLGLAVASATSSSVTNDTDLALNTPVTVLLRLTNGGPAQLWVNPTSEASPSVITPDIASVANITAFALRQAAGIGALTVDDLVVATTFNEALSGSGAPQPPVIFTQPISQVVTQGSNATFTVGVSGTAPLQYQWFFATTNLPNATNATLSLTNVQADQAGEYFVTVTNSLGVVTSEVAELTVYLPPPPQPPAPPLTSALSLLNYNAHGNAVGDWTTNNAQVRAFGRILAHLNPDIVTLQEIPMTNAGWSNMPNIIGNYLSGYYLATNSGTDGFIRSAIVSRYPIVRSQSWLDGADLNPYGYTNANFTRDLFEAEIAVPGFDLPLHVFTTHLKSGTSSSADAARRAAEASAISNYFVTTFLPTYSNRLYVLTGDLNEDVARPATGSQQPIQRLTSAPTGLRLTTPTNPITGSELTFSIQSVNGLTRRYDYILPCGTLFSNMASNLVFRSDLLNPVPANLFSNDVIVSSDHLPVMMWFANPYSQPFRLLSLSTLGNQVTLRWESASNRVYGVESSTNLSAWQPLVTNLVATGTNFTFTTNLADRAVFFRVYRLP